MYVYIQYSHILSWCGFHWFLLTACCVAVPSGSGLWLNSELDSPILSYDPTAPLSFWKFEIASCWKTRNRISWTAFHLLSSIINLHLLQDPLDSYRGFIYTNPLPSSTQHFSFSHFRSVVPLCCHQPHLSWVMLWIVPQKEPVPWYLKWWVDGQAHWSHQAHWHPPRLWHTEWDPSHSGIKEQSLSLRPPPI